MLFTGELVDMYANYSEWRGWKWTPLQFQKSDIGGVRTAIFAVEGEGAYASLRCVLLFLQTSLFLEGTKT